MEADSRRDFVLTTHVLQEAAADGQGRVGAALQILQEVLAVEVTQLLQIPKNNAALPSQVLRKVQPLHLREVVLDDVAERSHVLSLCGDHLVHDVLDFAERQWDAE